MAPRIRGLAFGWLLGIAVAAPAAVASTPACMVPFEECASRLDGFFGSPIDVPELVPQILTVCRRDAARYRTCAGHASVRDRATILARVAYLDEVVAAALLRLDREREARTYQHEAHMLATRLVNNGRLTEDERATMRFIVSGEPWFPRKNAVATFMDDNGFALAFLVAVCSPVLLAIIVVAAALLAPRRAL